ncbi:MAG: hypothetical protein ACYC6A_02650 [Armatimonadota bacterium]
MPEMPMMTLFTPLPVLADDSPVSEMTRQVLAAASPQGWAPTGFDRTAYLDLMEIIVRAAAGWQDASGAIIDPVAGIEHGQTSPRFAAPGAVLLAFGRVPELREAIERTMSWSCRRLADREAQSPDFWMRELMTAYLCLAPTAGPARVAEWAADLRRVDPERTYVYVKPDGQDLETLHNWTVYAMAGEWLREAAGLCGPEAGICGRAFVEKYLPPQLTHFSPEGMYRDPGDPITYDITTRLQAIIPLVFGYDGPASADLHRLLQRAGQAMLLLMTPDGYVPYGGRSSQFHFQEAIIAALCELEARRYREADPRLAGAFKRQAHRSTQAVRRWLVEMQPFRHIKNGFPPAAGHGRDTYGHYSVYSLLAASFFGLAALFADDEIAEAPYPAEIGGFVFALPDAFHKVFATCAGAHIEIDLRADPHYDATGLGRFTRAGVPLELGPGMPFTATPKYGLTPELIPGQPLAVGPAWPEDDGWQALAGLSGELQADCAVERESPSELAFTVTHHRQAVEIVQAYTLTEGRLHIHAAVRRDGRPVNRLGFQVPLLISDGEAESAQSETPGTVTVAYHGATLTVRYDAAYQAWIDPAEVANRNGIYRCLTLETPGHEMTVELLLASG